MKKIAIVLAAAALCVFGRTGVSVAADNYSSCVRDSVAPCENIRDDWESCRELYRDIADMCRSLYPVPKKSHR